MKKNIAFKVFKIINISLFIVMTLGFRSLTNKRWGITPKDPWLWVKICEGSLAKTFSTAEFNDFEDFKIDGQTEVTIQDLVTSLVADINNLQSTFVKVGVYPTDTSVYTLGFDLDTAGSRTVDLCLASTGIPGAGGVAKLSYSGNAITSCTMNIKQRDSAKSWAGNFVHEIGHCFGLDHPQASSSAIMSYYHKKGDGGIYRYQADDLMGVTYLYPMPHPGWSLNEEDTYGLGCGFK